MRARWLAVRYRTGLPVSARLIDAIDMHSLRERQDCNNVRNADAMCIDRPARNGEYTIN